MITKEQITEEFVAALKALLKIYGADITAEDGEDVRMTVTIPAINAPEGGQDREWTEIDLGRRVTCD